MTSVVSVRPGMPSVGRVRRDLLCSAVPDVAPIRSALAKAGARP
ncbi:hypothetical protein [Amycolatopsis sp. MtRt-6]|nr:hypothetical protein [Amycolatopsis sp. MtRt-6]